MPVTVERDGSIAVVVVDNPPVNATSQAVRAGLAAALAEVEADPAVEAAVLICAGRTFIAGADVSEFGKPPREPHLPDVIAAIERCPKPWVAAIHGTALGGGYELALACRLRVATADAKVGLPEVTLGLIPGAGGTQRLPRLVGLEVAAEMVTGGRPLAARDALRDGAIDAIAEGDLRAFAVAYARTHAGSAPPALALRPAPQPAEGWFDAAMKQTAAKARGQLSPVKALEALRASTELPFAEAMKREREIFMELRASEQSAALRHAFFAERAAAKPPGLGEAQPRRVERVAVIGGGTMGAGIAVAFLNAGLPVVMVERDPAALQRGEGNVRGLLEGAQKRGLISPEAMEHRWAAFSTTLDYGDLAQVDLAVEAVFEDMEVKRQVFRALDAALKPGAVLATNTSYLDVDAIAAATARPADVVGLHFFSPAHVMRLLEVVQAAKTAPEVVATAFALGKRLGKTAVLSGVCDGFIGNRILQVYRRQADVLLEEGCLPAEVDAAMRAFGLAMGPYEAQDMGGLDIAWANRKRQAATRDPARRYVAIADRLCEAGRFGQKTGAGWYRYETGDRRPLPDPDVEAIILEEASRKGITRRSFSEQEIQERILWPMVDEGARILEEGIAKRPLDIDVVEVHGYGFPRWRGGLMHWADGVGLPRILAGLEGFAAADGLPPPSALLRRLVAEGKGFGSLD